jgi:uncharacterized SAM-binding protein YcdF (DUF218 family)
MVPYRRRMPEFEVLEGTPGLSLGEIANIMIPGSGRNAVGDDISRRCRDRVLLANALYSRYGLAEKSGRIVCSGYKSPADTKGAPWSPGDSPGEVFNGVPEADGMRATLISLGVAEEAISVERHSIDTATNFARCEAEGHFVGDLPVAIVAQAAHLRRILEVVAPRTLRRDYLGVVVPEPAAAYRESRWTRVASRLILRGLAPDSPHLTETATRRAEAIWRAAGRMRVLAPHVHERYGGRDG